ncbi:MAG: inorganic phosphate transporter [Bacteroidia bacterium]|nr:inorganic phosphate transporter [Bacteroidia bacterium]
MNDAGNSIATIVSTGVLSPKIAVAWAAFFNFIAAFVFGVHVAKTVGTGIINPEILKGDPFFILTTLVGAGIWVYFCGHHGLPNSVSHALIGGLIGPALIKAGGQAIIIAGLLKVVIFIVLSPVIGFLLGYFMMVIVLSLFRNKTPIKVDRYFRILQLASSAAFSLGHGTNDAQKTMGIITVLLFSTGFIKSFVVPDWVILAACTSIALGTLIGAWKIIKTLGSKLTQLRPIGGFCAETAGAITLIGTSIAGIPVSTTHTITGAIMGVGITKRVSAVKWGIAGNIVTAWILTIPASAVVSGILYFIITLFK